MSTRTNTGTGTAAPPAPGTAPAHRSTIAGGVGELTVRPVDPDRDTPLLHRWLTHPKSAYWLQQDATAADVEREYRAIARSPHTDAWLGHHRGEPAFLVERYDPRELELKGLYPPQPGDVGMHFLVAPTDAPVHGFTLAVITTVMELLFSDPDTARVVVEPDVGNKAVHRLNEAVGFRIERRISKPEKDAYLSTCTREQFQAARGVSR
ncbi:acetyltransferase [Streptomyces sp. XM4193]|uniref:GNAT family N-acetyltransferase n=1 Tax=Streptomyces sp. XM4193 TaxID=2929782 RepID=UPI001FFC051F|nr:GNAT family N-acetyltransferase [Streptomyces sp. XM4193]MCK1799033.1 acetyltransferase [Streptomyces sp. XM4193]